MNTDKSRLFVFWRNCVLQEICDEEKFNTEKIIDMSDMFNNCEKLKKVYMSNLNANNVIKMDSFAMDYLLGRTEKNDYIESSNETFQMRFENLCKEKGVTHYKVSQDCFFDKSNISRWLTKGYLPTLEILDMITKYFNVSIDYILGRSDFRN